MPNKRPNVALRERIAQAAYFFWLRGGRRHGNDVADWLQAERELASGLVARSATPNRRSPTMRDAAVNSSGRIYRLRFLTPNGMTKLVMMVSAADDSQALSEAEHVRHGRRLEVWRGRDRIGVFPPEAA